MFSARGRNRKASQFTFRDNEKFSDTSMAPTSQIKNWEAPETGIRPRPAGKAAYYYVRVIQRYSRELPGP